MSRVVTLVRALRWVIAALALPAVAVAQQRDSIPPPAPAPAAPKPTPWYDRFSMRGYTQIRYNDLFLDNPDFTCSACDRSIGGVKDFSIRRSRLVFNALPMDQINIKFEIDLVNTVGNSQNYLQMRELYGDIFLDKGKNAWVRVGLAKVPYGFENLQSSGVRLPFDRDDALNSAAPGERDLGVFFVWGSTKAHRTLRKMTDSSFKGEGDYGILSGGIYNGQGANRAEANDNKHVALRLSYPFVLPAGQIVELSAQGYYGTYTLTADLRTPGVAAPEGYDFDDRRVALSAVLVPRPIGLQAEWNWGDGPRFDPARNATVNGTVDGGYVQATYRILLPKGRVLFPYARWQHSEGGKKNELDARYYEVDEFEVGAEFLVIRAVELTAAYVHGERRFEDGANPDNLQSADFVRLQLQLNY
jgi:phosphate-selective porin